MQQLNDALFPLSESSRVFEDVRAGADTLPPIHLRVGRPCASPKVPAPTSPGNRMSRHESSPHPGRPNQSLNDGVGRLPLRHKAAPHDVFSSISAHPYDIGMGPYGLPASPGRNARLADLTLPGYISNDAVGVLELELESYVASKVSTGLDMSHHAAGHGCLNENSDCPVDPAPPSNRLAVASALSLTTAHMTRPLTAHVASAARGKANMVPRSASPVHAISNSQVGYHAVERHPRRREVQAMNEWLDVTISQAWAAHAAVVGDLAGSAGLRDEAPQSAQQLRQDHANPASLQQATSSALRDSMTLAATVCASGLAQRLSAWCIEEGVLFTRLWNLHTSLMNAEILATSERAKACAATASKLEQKVSRLEPVVDWERESRIQLDSLREELSAERMALQLARSERDALLRENDKIIKHYRHELKTFKQQQRKDAFKLARKVRITQQTLKLVEADRLQLLSAVLYTRSEAITMHEHVCKLHNAVKEGNAAGIPSDVGVDLEMIEQGLNSIVDAVGKLSAANQAAEEQHFVHEEQVTMCAAKDDVDDGLVDEVLAGGDPDNNNKPYDEVGNIYTRDDAVESDSLSDGGGDEDLVDDDETGGGSLTQLQGVPTEDSSNKLVDDEDAATLTATTDPQHTTTYAHGTLEDSSDALPSSAAADNSPLSTFAKSGPDERASVPLVSCGTQTITVLQEQASVQTGEEFLQDCLEKTANRARVHAAKQILTAASSVGVDLGDLPAQLAASGDDDAMVTALEALVSSVDTFRSQAEANASEVAALSKAQEEQAARASVLIQETAAVHEQAAACQQQLDELHSKLKVAGINPDAPVFIQGSSAAVQHMHVAPSEPDVTSLRSDGRPTSSTSPLVEPADFTQPSKTLKKDAVSGSRVDNEQSSAAVSKIDKVEVAAEEKHSKFRQKISPDQVSILTEASSVSKAALRQAASKSPPKRASPSRTSAKTTAIDSASQAPGSSSKPQRHGGPLLHKRPYGAGDGLRRTEQTAGARLHDAIARHSNVRPRTLDWLLKLIDGIYKSKAANDELRVKSGQGPMPLLDFLFQHLAGMYGARELVNQYVAQVIATLNAFKGSEPRLATFQKCLDGVWSPSVLSVYIDGMRKLAEPARLPCIDFPADFSPRRGGEPVADVRKCLWVADKLLFKRHNKTAYAFAAALALKGEPVTDAELSQFFVAPGYYGPDVATMQAYERSRAEFRRVPVHMFLEELCKEYIRCEKVLFDLLPQLFSRWDSDGDGLMKRSDISSMLEHMAQKGTPLQELEAEADAFWTRMVSSDASSADGGNAPAVGDAIAVHSDNVPMPAVMLSCAAFMQAAPQSSTLRAYVRLYKTPPARVRNNFSTEEQVRLLLLVLISRHWSCHGPFLSKHFDGMGSLQAKVREMSDTMVKEQDGMRKALMLHALLKVMINQRLDRLIEQVTPSRNSSSTTSALHPEFESGLLQLTTAVKVLYGERTILVDEIADMQRWECASPAQQDLLQQELRDVMSLYQTMRQRIEGVALTFLGHHRGVRRWLQQWRANARKRSGTQV